MNTFVIGLDSSTTATKAIAVDMDGKIVAQAYKALRLYQPQAGYFEQDAKDWWHSAKVVLLEITKQIDPKRIKALAISNQRETFVPLDRDGNALRPAIVWLDERCKDEVEPFAQLIGYEKIHRITGKPVDYAPVIYRLAWMKKHEPELYRNISMICDVQCWLVWKLTNRFKTSWASADPLGMFDMEKKQWSKEILSALNLSEKQLPQLHSPGTNLAKIADKAAQESGLSRDTIIISGSGDGQAAGLGINALDPQRAYLNLGTAVVAGIYNTDYIASKAFRTLCACSDRGYYYECSLRAGTFAIDWFIRNILAVDPDKQADIYSALEKKAQKITAGSAGLMFLPYINGAMNPYWDKNARGAFSGLSSVHTQDHMYRAILEGIAFEQLLSIQSVEEAVNIKINKLITIGGGSKSALWCKILADITGKDICIPESKEASALGASIAAAVGSGLYSSFNEAANQMASIEKMVKPDLQLHEKYQYFFEMYKKLFPALRAVHTKNS